MIYVNGDSWTSGWPDEETYGHREFSWPHILSTKLEQPVFNDARAGSSNYRIYRKTFDYLLNNHPTIAIVFLTSWTRVELGDVKSGKIYQHLPTRDPAFYKTYWNPYLAYTNLLRQIVSLQNIAKQTNTELFLLDSFDDNLNRTPDYTWFTDILKEGQIFDCLDDEQIRTQFNKLDAINNHIDYSKFISVDSYESLIRGCKLEQLHPVKDGHALIANVVYNYLENKGVIYG